MGYSESFVDLVKDDENLGKLKTGDLAKKDSDGFYFITGRKKRFIKIFGNRINLDEIEQILKTIHLEIVCIGEDDSLIIFTTDISKENDIKKSLIQTVRLNPKAFSLRFIEKIPITSSGKVDYPKLIQNEF